MRDGFISCKEKNTYILLDFLIVYQAFIWIVYVLCSLQSCPTLCDPMDYSLPGSSLSGILQVRILESVAIPFSKDQTWVSCIAGRLMSEPPGKPLKVSIPTSSLDRK